jgi:hypothetical protein
MGGGRHAERKRVEIEVRRGIEEEDRDQSEGKRRGRRRV